ncbi:MAG: divergent polysaccharide deacetylase family protein [Candidatus Omnitrophica bacterium]|nr:divergent polysaccharide deacetylase family protein [Candidatus Omnitrophota bacterium]
MKNRPLIIIAVSLALLLFIALILTPIYKKTPAKKKVAAVKGIIAIVIDDWGYHLDNLAIIKKIKVPLTCAILPNLKNSGPVARELNGLGFEIILHLPMEPKEKYRLESNTITSAMDAGQIHDILDEDLASVIFAKGISNHMGSQITEDEKISTIVMAEAKKRKLYFLDSFVTAKSVCREVSAKIKAKFARRDIFLDNQNDPAYIRGQLMKLKNLARRRKNVVAIGHDRRNTLALLNEMLPMMKREGYRFVFLSEIAR